MKREVIENLTVENEELICYITRKELTDTESDIQVMRFFDKIKIARKSDKKTILSFKGEDESEAFVDICQKVMSISGYKQTYVPQQQPAPVIPFTTTNPEMFAQGQTVQNISNSLPPPAKVNIFEVKEEGNGITAIVQVNRAEQEAQELARANDGQTEEELLKKMAKDFKALTEADLPPEKKKALEEKKKKFPGFFNAKN